jgi:uncharacterized repeat protein (TIGR03803 family)
MSLRATIACFALATIFVPLSQASAAARHGFKDVRTADVVFSFGGAGGAAPSGTLIADRGALFGATAAGGTTQHCGHTVPSGCGTVFRITHSASAFQETVLYQFGDMPDGRGPTGALVADATGALYGATRFGGLNRCPDHTGCGVIFKLTPSSSGYTETVLHRFGGTGDGETPNGSLIVDASGALYGTTSFGGAYGSGMVFRLSPSARRYVETDLYDFTGGSDGAIPAAGLTFALGGVLLGTTFGGGFGSNELCLEEGGCGTVFALTPAGPAYSESVVYSFADIDEPGDGIFPASAIVADAAGNLYGTTERGGSGLALGTVYKLTRELNGTYAESVLHSFQGGHDGAFPDASPVVDGHGGLIGPTPLGGKTPTGCFDDSGCGIIYKLAPNASGYTMRIVYNFDTAYAEPNASLLRSGGFLYGTTVEGGANGVGTLFALAR